MEEQETREKPRRRPFGKKGKKHARKAETIVDEEDDGPNCFVIRKGKCSASVKRLTTDFRLVMSPRTASHLKEKKSNTLRDYMAVSSQLKVTHFYVFSSTSVGNAYLRVAKFPSGPTIVFRIEKFCLQQYGILFSSSFLLSSPHKRPA